MGTLPFNVFGLPWEANLRSTYWGSLIELTEVIALARTGRVSARIERFSLDDAPIAYDRLRAGKIDGRAVVVP